MTSRGLQVGQVWDLGAANLYFWQANETKKLKPKDSIESLYFSGGALCRLLTLQLHLHDLARVLAEKVWPLRPRSSFVVGHTFITNEMSQLSKV